MNNHVHSDSCSHNHNEKVDTTQLQVNTVDEKHRDEQIKRNKERNKRKSVVPVKGLLFHPVRTIRTRTIKRIEALVVKKEKIKTQKAEDLKTHSEKNNATC